MWRPRLNREFLRCSVEMERNEEHEFCGGQNGTGSQNVLRAENVMLFYSRNTPRKRRGSFRARNRLHVWRKEHESNGKHHHAESILRDLLLKPPSVMVCSQSAWRHLPGGTDRIGRISVRLRTRTARIAIIGPSTFTYSAGQEVH